MVSRKSQYIEQADRHFKYFRNLTLVRKHNCNAGYLTEACIGHNNVSPLLSVLMF